LVTDREDCDEVTGLRHPESQVANGKQLTQRAYDFPQALFELARILRSNLLKEGS